MSFTIPHRYLPMALQLGILLKCHFLVNVLPGPLKESAACSVPLPPVLRSTVSTTGLCCDVKPFEGRNHEPLLTIGMRNKNIA